MTEKTNIHILADEKFSFNDEEVPTPTSIEQKKIESEVYEENLKLNNNFLSLKQSETKKFELQRELHTEYVLKSLRCLPKVYMSMDASRPWFCYWGTHSLRLLGCKPDKNLMHKIVVFLKKCEASTGGYGGGPGQLPHLATTYAAVMALISIGTAEALDSIDRNKLRNFLVSMKQKNGSFSLHKNGEIDIRGVYCAIAIAFITNIVDEELFNNTASWILQCQTYEGGFGGDFNCEAHGGYTFCAMASLALLKKNCLINVHRVLDWLVKRQLPFEGGFNGRSNKLVDGCYSFWQSATFSILECEISYELKQPIGRLFDHIALQNYILIICQDRENGGLRDKTKKLPDLYHTCYTLSGLSIAQSYAISPDEIIGGSSNRLEAIHPLYNVCIEMEAIAKNYFSSKFA